MNILLKRCFGWIIDKIIVFILFIISCVFYYGPYVAPAILGEIAGTFIASPSLGLKYIGKFDEFNQYHHFMLFIIAIVVFVIIDRLYYLLFEIIWGGSVGKKIMNLKTIGNDGEKLKFSNKLLSAISYWAFYFIVLFLMIRFFDTFNWFSIIIITNSVLILPAFFTKKKQPFYDLYNLVEDDKKDDESKIESKKIALDNVNNKEKKPNENIETNSDLNDKSIASIVIDDNIINTNSKLSESYYNRVIKNILIKKKIFKLISYFAIATTIILVFLNCIVYFNEYYSYEKDKTIWEQQENRVNTILFNNSIKKYNYELNDYYRKVNSYSLDTLGYSDKIRSYDEEMRIYGNKISKYYVRYSEWKSNLSSQELEFYQAHEFGRNIFDIEDYYRYQKLHFPIAPTRPTQPELLTYPIKPIYPQKAKVQNFPNYYIYSNLTNNFWDIRLNRNPLSNILPCFTIFSLCILGLFIILFFIQKFKQISNNIKYFTLIFSLILSFNFINFFLRWIIYYYYSNIKSLDYNYNEINLLDNVLLYFVALILITIVFFVIFNFIFSGLVKRRYYYFPLNSGINRILILLFSITTTFNEVSYLINESFSIGNNDFQNIFKFDNYDSYYYRDGHESFCGITIMFFFICAYFIFIWVYNGFKQKE